MDFKKNHGRIKEIEKRKQNLQLHKQDENIYFIFPDGSCKPAIDIVLIKKSNQTFQNKSWKRLLLL